MRRTSINYFLFALVLAGCTSYTDQGRDALNRGDCSTAEQLFIKGAQAGEAMSYNNLGVVYQNCYRDREKAIYFYTIAARYGIPLAISNLTNLGAPVPPPDLAARRPSAEENAALMSYAASLMRGNRAPQPTYGGAATGAAFLKRNYVSGFNRICVYDRMGSDYVVTIGAAQICPLTQ